MRNLTAKSRTIAVRLISMALTGYYKTLVRPRQHRPLSMLKYDPVGMLHYFPTVSREGRGQRGRDDIEGDVCEREEKEKEIEQVRKRQDATVKLPHKKKGWKYARGGR